MIYIKLPTWTFINHTKLHRLQPKEKKINNIYIYTPTAPSLFMYPRSCIDNVLYGPCA